MGWADNQCTDSQCTGVQCTDVQCKCAILRELKALCYEMQGSSMFSKAGEQTCVKAMCNRSGQASLAAALIKVLSVL